MPAAPVVPDLNTRKDGLPCRIARSKGTTMHHLALQAGKKALHHRIVPAVAATAHATHDPCLSQQRLILQTRILTASVAVADQTRTRTTLRKRSFHGSDP